MLVRRGVGGAGGGGGVRRMDRGGLRWRRVGSMFEQFKTQGLRRRGPHATQDRSAAVAIASVGRIGFLPVVEDDTKLTREKEKIIEHAGCLDAGDVLKPAIARGGGHRDLTLQHSREE